VTDWLRAAERQQIVKRAAKKAARRAMREAAAGGFDETWEADRTKALMRRYATRES
jgi:hypothetical protein